MRSDRNLYNNTDADRCAGVPVGCLTPREPPPPHGANPPCKDEAARHLGVRRTSACRGLILLRPLGVVRPSNRRRGRPWTRANGGKGLRDNGPCCGKSSRVSLREHWGETGRGSGKAGGARGDRESQPRVPHDHARCAGRPVESSTGQADRVPEEVDARSHGHQDESQDRRPATAM
jgi:hypothetical protein